MVMNKDVIKCDNCKKDNSNSANFCQFCGEPLTELAKKFQKERITTSQLLLLSSLTNKVEDAKTLMIIKNLVSKLQDLK